MNRLYNRASHLPSINLMLIRQHERYHTFQFSIFAFIHQAHNASMCPQLLAIIVFVIPLSSHTHYFQSPSLLFSTQQTVHELLGHPVLWSFLLPYILCA